MKRISVIIPIYGFSCPSREYAIDMAFKSFDAQDLRVCDENNKPTTEKDFEVIYVEQASDPSHGYHHSFQPRPYLKHLKLPPQKAFNKSWCMNVAAKEANSNALVFLDADLLFGSDFLSKIYYFHRDVSKRYFTCWHYIMGMPGKDEPILRVIDTSILTAGGAFCVDKTFYWSVGGMNENYFGYGGEDNDLWVRVNPRLGKKGENNIQAMPYALVHCYHDWAEPSPERFEHLNRTVQYPDKVIERLRNANLGKPDGPTIVNMSDIKLDSDARIEKETSRGLL